MTQLLLGIAPDWVPTLENFVAGRNLELLAALRQAATRDVAGRCFYLWGEPGSGKTHLLRATIEAARLKGQAATYACGVIPEPAPIVGVDEVEALDEAGQVALFELFNRQRETGGVLLVCGSAAPAYLKVRDDLRTRLGWGLVYQVHALNDAEKSSALETHAQARGFDLPSEVTQYLLRHGRRDLPSLLAVLDALDQQCLRLKRLPTVHVLKEVMENIK
jgi:DnaA family protein